MKNFLKNFVRDESGASAAEYVLILAIIGSGIAAGAVLLGTSIETSLETAATYIDENAIGE
jgi:pilus assembly protein Flp/PilA